MPLSTRVSFDDPNLLSHAGLVPLAALAERSGLHDSAAANVRLGGSCGASAGLKTGCLAAGMAAGADSIDDMDLLRHGAMDKVSGGVRAPSTPGSFLRAFTWGNVSQLQKTHREVLASLARGAPLLPGAGTLAFIDLDSTQSASTGTRRRARRSGTRRSRVNRCWSRG